MTRGILGTTVCFGARRVDDNGHAARRVADADEDLVTLTIAAVRAHLAKNGHDAARIDNLVLVGRFDDAASATLTTMLDRPSLDVTRVPDAPSAALDAVVAAHRHEDDHVTYVVAADDGRGAQAAGRGAAAALVSIGPGADVRVVREAAHRDARTDASTHAGAVVESLGGLADEAVALAPALQRPTDARRIVPPGATRNVLAAPVEQVGATGCAAPLIALAHGLDARGAGHELVWWTADTDGAVGARLSAGSTPEGSGVLDAVGSGAVPITPEAAERARAAWASGGRPAQGAFVSMQTYLGQAAARYRWIAQRCAACGYVMFPPRECCPDCGAAETIGHPLAGTGTVHARTRIGTGGAPTEFAPLQDATGPYDVAIVALTEGPRVAAMCTAATKPPAIGDRVRLALRLLYVQDGVARYGFKAVPDGRA